MDDGISIQSSEEGCQSLCCEKGPHCEMYSWNKVAGICSIWVTADAFESNSGFISGEKGTWRLKKPTKQLYATRATGFL